VAVRQLSVAARRRPAAFAPLLVAVRQLPVVVRQHPAAFAPLPPFHCAAAAAARQLAPQLLRQLYLQGPRNQARGERWLEAAQPPAMQQLQ